MKLLYAAILLTYLALVCNAQVTTNGFQTTTFANLPTVSDGKVRFVVDGSAGSPCTGGGSGAYAYRIGGIWVCNAATAGGGGGAPTDATYITQTTNATLTNEQALSSLSTGLMRSATSTGVVTTINTSAGVAANISDETGTSLLVFNTSPTLTTPAITTPTITTSILLNGAVSVTSSSAGNLTLGPNGDLITDPVGNDILPATNYDINIGSLPKKYLTLNAAELWVETLVAQNTLATFGGRILIAPSNILIADLTNVATTIDVKYNNFTSGDRVYMEANGSVEFMAVTSGSTPITGGYRYSVTRNLDGTGANAWSAGDALVDTGQTGNGFIDAYSITGIPSATSTGIGPSIVGNVRNSATYNDWSPTWAIGNLDGTYGYSGSTYGVAFGKYAASNSQILIDSTNGIRIRNGTSTIIGQWSTAGVITIGEVGASKDNIQISSGAISIRNNTTERIGMTAAGIMTIKDSSGAAVLTFDASSGAEITKKLTMPGASSAISIGVTPPASAASGTGIWLDRTGLYGLLSDVVQASLSASTGIISAGAGNVTLDATGLKLVAGVAAVNSVSWNSGLGNYIGNMFTYTTGSDVGQVVNVVNPANNHDAQAIYTAATVSGSTDLEMVLYAKGATSTSYMTISGGTSGGTNFKGVAIGTTSAPTTSALLDLSSTKGALLVPRMTSTQRDALTATNGMVLYNSTTDKLQVRAAGAWVDLH